MKRIQSLKTDIFLVPVFLFIGFAIFSCGRGENIGIEEENINTTPPTTGGTTMTTTGGTTTTTGSTTMTTTGSTTMTTTGGTTTTTGGTTMTTTGGTTTTTGGTTTTTGGTTTTTGGTTTTTGGTTTTTGGTTMTIDDTPGVRYVFLEKITGQDCPNCPGAQTFVDRLLANPDYERLITVNIHAGGLSRTPLRITKGQDIYNTLGFTYQPQATINRTRVLASTSQWVTEVQNELNKPALVTIQMTLNYDTASRNLEIQTSARFHEDNNEALKFTLYLMEDNIVAYQARGGSNYNHRHVLRDVITATFGDAISPSSQKKGDVIQLPPYTTNVAANFKIQDISVIGFISRASDNYIFQVIQKDL